jgi:hypothetical protein
VIAARVLRDGRVVRETVLSSVPLTIGRGPECDLVLFDDSVSRAHARIEAGGDGGLRLVDLGSRNGIRVDNVAVEAVALDRRLRCRIGLVQLELEPLLETPTREVRAPEWRRFERRRAVLDQLRYLVLGVAALVLGDVVQPSFWSPWKHTRSVDLLGAVLAAVVLLVLAAGALFVVLKAFGRRVRLSDTLRTLAFLAWLEPATRLVLLAAYYPLSPGAFAWFTTAAWVGVAVVTVVAMAGVRRHPPSVRFAVAWAVAGLALALGVVSTSALYARRMGQPNVDVHVQVPVAGHAGRSGTLEDYLERVTKATREAEDAAAEVRARLESD